MDYRSIINEICDQADDFLADVAKRDEAKAGISEWLTMHHAKLPPADKRAIVEQSMRVLEEEGFFEAVSDGGSSEREKLDGFSEE
jgi:hypothetical protein